MHNSKTNLQHPVTHFNSKLKETSIYDLPETELVKIVKHYSTLAATIGSYVKAKILHPVSDCILV